MSDIFELPSRGEQHHLPLHCQGLEQLLVIFTCAVHVLPPAQYQERTAIDTDAHTHLHTNIEAPTQGRAMQNWFLISMTTESEISFSFQSASAKEHRQTHVLPKHA